MSICVFVPPTDGGLPGRDYQDITEDGLDLTVEYSDDLVWREVLACVRGLIGHLWAVKAAVVQVVAKPPRGVEVDRDMAADFWITVDDPASPKDGAKLEIPGLRRGNQACEITWDYMLEEVDNAQIQQAIRNYFGS